MGWCGLVNYVFKLALFWTRGNELFRAFFVRMFDDISQVFWAPSKINGHLNPLKVGIVSTFSRIIVTLLQFSALSYFDWFTISNVCNWFRHCSQFLFLDPLKIQTFFFARISFSEIFGYLYPKEHLSSTCSVSLCVHRQRMLSEKICKPERSPAELWVDFFIRRSETFTYTIWCGCSCSRKYFQPQRNNHKRHVRVKKQTSLVDKNCCDWCKWSLRFFPYIISRIRSSITQNILTTKFNFDICM